MVAHRLRVAVVRVRVSASRLHNLPLFKYYLSSFMLKNKISRYLQKILKQLNQEQNWNLPAQFTFPLNNSNNKEHGDYNTPLLLLLSKFTKQNPLALGNLFQEKIKASPLKEIQKIEIVPPGYLNIFVTPQSLQKALLQITPLLPTKKNASKNIIVEYSSPNIAKPMHVGHLRSTIIGETLARLHQIFGYHVIKWNYLGDWGTQFGKLIVAYKLWGKKQEVQKNPIQTLLSLYQKFHQEVKKHPELDSLAQQEFKKLEQGDLQNRKLWQWFKKESLKEFKKIYKLLGIKFDIFKGESDFENDLTPLLHLLKQKQLVQKSQGALIVPLEQFDLPPALIQKSDEASLYLTRDLASLLYRLQQYKPAKILYVVGNEQELYFKQLFAIAKLLNAQSKTELIHVKFGLILNTNKKKFSTRTGELISLNEVIQEATQKALQIIKKKHPQWSLKKQTKLAQSLALGALKFNSLKSFRTADIVFHWEQMLNFQGDSSVYLQYTYARFYKILKRAKKISSHSSFLTQNLELEIIKELLAFPESLEKSLQEYAPHYLVNYLITLADLVNQYYETIPLLKEANPQVQAARLFLIQKIILIFNQGFEILGIDPLKEI